MRSVKKLLISAIILIFSTQVYGVEFKTKKIGNRFEIVAVCIAKRITFVTMSIEGSVHSIRTGYICERYKKLKLKPLISESIK